MKQFFFLSNLTERPKKIKMRVSDCLAMFNFLAMKCDMLVNGNQH